MSIISKLNHGASGPLGPEAPATKPRSRLGRQVTYTAVVALTALIGYAVIKATNSQNVSSLPGSGVITTSPLVGQTAPNFKLSLLSDTSRTISLSSLSGKPIVINFFSPACVPCHEEMPTFASLGKKYAKRINFIGVDETSSPGAALSFVTADHVSYPTVLDANGDLIGPYLIPGVPVTVFVGSNGVITGYVAGAISNATLTARVKDLLGN